MPSRNQTMIRRDINRLKETIERNKSVNPALPILLKPVASCAEEVNRAWQNYQQIAVNGDKERVERDEAKIPLIKWIQRWRPIILIVIPGADDNIKKLASSGATPDDVIRVAEDMISFLKSKARGTEIAEAAAQDLGDKLESAKKETGEASEALLQEEGARAAYSEACLKANSILVKALATIRSIFGSKSREYKQFIARDSAEAEKEIDSESEAGE